MKIIDRLFQSNIFKNQDTAKSVKAESSQSGDDPFAVFKNAKTPGMDRVGNLLRKLDHPVSDSEAASIERFVKDGSGSMESKLETIHWAADKGVEMTDKNLSAIQETMNTQRNEADMIETLAGTKEITEGEAKDILEKIKKDPNIPSAIKKNIQRAIESGMPLNKVLVNAVENLVHVKIELKGSVVFIENSSQGGACVCANLEDFLSAVQAALSNLSGDQSDFADLLKSALQNASGLGLDDALESIFSDKTINSHNLEETVDEFDANEILSTEENDDEDTFENEMLQRLEASFDEVMDAFMENADGEMVSALSDMRFKQFLVEKVTAQAIEAKQTFKDMQKDIVQSLKNIEIPQTASEKVDVSEVLSKAIEKLDNVLMKSDVSLFTSMKMERDLLNMSSTLQEARKLLNKGDVNGALEITKTVQNKLSEMTFTPSEKNIQLMAYKEGMNVLDMKQNIMPAINWQDTSPRGVLELFRNMGLNHEPEVAEKLLSQGKGLQRDDDYKIKDNLKAVLLKLMENNEPDQKRTVAAAERSLNNLTGQQLMNKLETQKETQTLFFHVPVEADGEIKDMKLYVNARKNGDALDWENSSLYFSVELSTYGETGIHLQSKDRLLSINVRNDKESFEQVMKPLVTALQKEFVDIGYKLGPVRFSSLDNKAPRDIVKPGDIQNPPQKKTVAPRESAPKKGFDFSI
ncbi:hypothetical protein [Fusibacter sp. JL216-2]|uniref:hypothetical protein n=1 Tax=Fusibacter sp. JL216-2 TaxID=3071453 RepID=UPI003D34EE7D